MTKYGIPYSGSKQAIADDIIAVLPSGKRFIDLFGGGFAMSQCALMSGKYDKVVYSDCNEPLIRLLRDVFAGQYNYTMFVCLCSVALEFWKQWRDLPIRKRP